MKLWLLLAAALPAGVLTLGLAPYPEPSLAPDETFLSMPAIVSNATMGEEPKQVVALAPAAEQNPEVAKPDIRFPSLPVQGGVTTAARLDKDVLYVVTSDKHELLAWSFPDGLLSVTMETGPIRIRGKFIDGFGKTETRNFTAKYIMIVEAVGTGRTSLLVLPVGAKAQSDGIIKLIDANNGSAPKPEPDPGPKPKPDPEPTGALIDFPGLAVLVVYESSQLVRMSKGQLQALQGQVTRDYLKDHCYKEEGKHPAYRIYDKDVVLTNEKKQWRDAMARPRSSVPWIVISNPQRGGGFEGPLPDTFEAITALLKKYGGE